MKKVLIIIALVFFLIVNMMAQTRQRPRDLTAETAFTGSEVFLLDRSDYSSTTFKMMTLTQITNFVLSQGSGGVSTFADLTDTDITGITTNKIPKWNGTKWVMADDEVGAAGTSDHKFMINANDDAAGYWDDNISAGDFIVFDNDDTEVVIEGQGASTTDTYNMSTVNRIVRPNNLPYVAIDATLVAPNNTIKANGLSLERAWNGNQIIWRVKTDIHSLSEALSIDPYQISIAIDDNLVSKRVGMFTFMNAIEANNFEIVVHPDWWQIPAEMAGQAYSAYTGILRGDIQIWKDNSEITTAASSFSAINIIGLTGVSFERVSDISSGYVVNLKGTVAAGTYGTGGDVIWSCDIKYTDPSTGVIVTKSVGTTDPITSGGGAVGDDQPGFTNGPISGGTIIQVQLVDAWPATAVQGIFMKLGEPARIYYTDKGTCAWGHEELDGTNGVCEAIK